MLKKQTFALSIGVILAATGVMQSRRSLREWPIKDLARAVLTGPRVTATNGITGNAFCHSANFAGSCRLTRFKPSPPTCKALQPGLPGRLLCEWELAGSGHPDRRPTNNLAVVPIIINTGAALFPTLLAFLANIAALVFNPKALGRLLRQRWRLAVAVTASLAFVIFGAVPLLRTAPLSRTTASAGALSAGQINWAKVAEDLIAQEKLHQTAAVLAPAPASPAPANAVPADAPARTGQVAPASVSDAGMSPSGLTPLWRFQPEDGLFLGKPAIAGKRIYVSANQTDLGGYTGLLASLDLDTGKPLWQVTEIGKDALPPFFSSPAVTADGEFVIIGQGLHQDRDSSLLCFETATGKLHWAVKTQLHIESSPAIFGDMVVVGAGAIEGNDGKPVGDPGYVFAVRISDGKQLWKQAVNDPESSPAIDDAGIVYIGSGFNGKAVVALRSGSDDELREQKLDRLLWRTALAYPITAPVTLAGDLVIVGGGNGDMVHSDPNPQGLVVALNRKTGQVVWQTKFEDAVLGRIAVRDGMMLCPLRTGEVAALSVADGHILWRSRVSGTAPVLAGGALTKERAYVVSSDGYLVAFAASTGKMLEKVYLNDQGKPGSGLSISSPQVVGNRIVVGSETGGLRAFLGTGNAK